VKGVWFMDDKVFLSIMDNGVKYQLQNIIACNQYTEKFGVRLLEKDALLLLESRKNNLKEQERIEFGEGILSKLIFAFCDSAYIYQDNYVDTIGALQEIFYLYKNESLDELSDDELLDYMKEHFNGDCQGSLDYLEETCLEEFCREIRSGSHRFLGVNREDE
jgi:hypothetical protein